jgi:transposase
VESVTAEIVGQRYHWQERRLVIRSYPLAQAAERGLRVRLAKAQAEIMALQTSGRSRRRWTEPSVLREAVEAILAHCRVSGLLAVRYREQ